MPQLKLDLRSQFVVQVIDHALLCSTDISGCPTDASGPLVSQLIPTCNLKILQLSNRRQNKLLIGPKALQEPHSKAQISLTIDPDLQVQTYSELVIQTQVAFNCTDLSYQQTSQCWFRMICATSTSLVIRRVKNRTMPWPEFRANLIYQKERTFSNSTFPASISDS